MSKTTSKPAARKPKAASCPTTRQVAGNRRKTASVDPVKANSPKAKAAEITTSDGLAKPARATKLMLIIGLLRRSKGATLAELTSATGWQAHSVRGALAGALRQRGFAIESTKTDGIRRYRIMQGDADAVNPANEATP